MIFYALTSCSSRISKSLSWALKFGENGRATYLRNKFCPSDKLQSINRLSPFVVFTQEEAYPLWFLCSFIQRQPNFKIIKLSAKIWRKWSCKLSAGLAVRKVAAISNLQLICGTNSVRQMSCSRLTDCHRLLFLHKEKPILCDFSCSFFMWFFLWFFMCGFSSCGSRISKFQNR